ncbi:MAG: MFS transporter [Bacteroidia bacterium]|nr:MFS transporter [Bacteroidia bacterium]MDW8417606.1 MFS transporter [Bacteroidia bacterium]
MRPPWQIPVILAVTTFIHYLDRNALALALPRIADEQRWSDTDIGLYGEYLLGAFYISFGLIQIFFSGYAEKWSVKGGLMLSVGGFSISTLLFYPFGYTLGNLIALRGLLGAAESLHMPMNSAIVARTFPPQLRGRANSIYVGGILLALMLGPILLIPLIEALGWRVSFGLLGFAGLVIALPLVYWGIPSLPSGISYKTASPRLSGTFWLYVAAGAANAFCIFGMLNWLPSFLTHSRGIPFSGLSGPLLAIFSAGILGVFLWAWIGDRTQNRLLWAIIGLAIAGVSVGMTAIPMENSTLLTLLTLGVFFQSSYNAQEFATLQSLYPAHQVGKVTGLYNGLTVLIGGVGGSFIPGLIIAWTGSFQKAILSIAVGAGIVALLLLTVRAHLRKA